ncbi:UDP-N-acetylmuramoyl-tripeptide--D-alanyl-D-alanine ligase [Sporomusaceae bacterium BoRhaA]|uniref:UDP-N-acetylmuramoyl-tripeptide--D-alanyl-D- alanine ligase n=1 Tax=Pelorhabdus rhamnosifermentans TaxID=2772457 RepID=UPI001C060FDC|nr:UDP-N-acetylmuramoyl-tripeptide--D-alanyl-D-alanine ligase [Pelorhabdus rhamnosifermentans]MBU2702992.1 UDP-N-acetylmuramoyl-tripeptide--D-alanyl-D-alanine ligase [Pelorhabdus rhamnosifermentans]
MAKFTLNEICLATGGQLVAGSDCNFSGICTDSRKIKSGQLFIALMGENFDGHQFTSAVVQQGAAGVLVSQNVVVPDSLPVIKCDDTLKALQDIAAYHRQRFTLPVIAITGSNGKTTTKDMLAAILSKQFKVLKTQANFNNEIGLPFTLLSLQPEHEVAVVEMGMRGLGQITALTRIARPTAGIVTTVGETHMELLGSRENIAKAKAELVEAIDPQGFVVLNADNPYVAAMASKARCAVITFGLRAASDVQGKNVRSSVDGVSFDCTYDGRCFAVHIPALGEHNVMNALAALAAGFKLGMNEKDMVVGLKQFAPSGMRMAIEKVGPYQIINDAYNASPASMVSALQTLVCLRSGRTVAVLGDMFELGELAEQAHGDIGKTAAQLGVDLIVTVGKLGQLIADGAQLHGHKAVFACQNQAEALLVLHEKLVSGDVILIKGSRGMKMEQLIPQLVK